MKKIVVMILALALCFGTMAILVGCGNNNADLLERIAALEKQLEDGSLKGDKGDTGATGPQGPAGSQGPKGESANSDTARIYKFGETATIYFNGMPMFSITYKVRCTTTSDGEFTFKNIALKSCWTNDVIAASDYNADFSAGGRTIIKNSLVNQNSPEVSLASFYLSINQTRIYFHSPTSLITYAIF